MNVKEQMDYDALKRELADCKAELSRRAAKVAKVEPMVGRGLCGHCVHAFCSSNELPCSVCMLDGRHPSWESAKHKPQCPDMGGSCVEVCGYQHKGKCDNGIDEAAKPKLEQTAGEGAIAIEPLRGEDSGGLTYNAFQKINELIDAVNRKREGK